MSVYSDFVNLPHGARVKFTRAYEICPADETSPNALLALADMFAIVQFNKLNSGERVINVLTDSSALRAACLSRLGHEDFDVGPVGTSLEEDCPFDVV